jgi:hypothetical protein
MRPLAGAGRSWLGVEQRYRLQREEEGDEIMTRKDFTVSDKLPNDFASATPTTRSLTLGPKIELLGV